MWPFNATYSTRIAVFFFVMAMVGLGLIFGLGRSIKARVGDVDISKMPQFHIDDTAKSEIDKMMQPTTMNHE
ncbi:MAG: hypothetical protein HYV65_00590 [Candidatus Spechtbacteria bacterium]|nr:hypothetical protein [Candidatus Spechtbacteria bacterium]